MPRQATFEDRKGVQFSLDKQTRDQLADLVRATNTSASQVVRELIAVAHASGLTTTTQEHNHDDSELGELEQ